MSNMHLVGTINYKYLRGELDSGDTFIWNMLWRIFSTKTKEIEKLHIINRYSVLGWQTSLLGRNSETYDQRESEL